MSACKYCDATIAWKKRDGRNVPIDAGSEKTHRCPFMPRSIARHKGGRGNHVAGRRIVGANYRPACGECAAAPWEPCACSERLAA